MINDAEIAKLLGWGSKFTLGDGFKEVIKRLRSAEGIVKKAADSELNSEAFGFVKEARDHLAKVYINTHKTR